MSERPTKLWGLAVLCVTVWTGDVVAYDGFGAVTQVLRTEGGNFHEIGAALAKAVNTLQQGLTGLEGTGVPPWGDDDLGEKFGVVYEGVRDGMYESMGHLATRLQEIGGALKSMADNHDSTEDFNNALMQQETARAQVEGGMIRRLSSPNTAA